MSHEQVYKLNIQIMKPSNTPSFLNAYICISCEKTYTGLPEICRCLAKFCSSCNQYNRERVCCQERNNSLKDINKNALSEIRIIQKNLVYIIGLAPKIASESILKKHEYLGQYGNIQKVIVITSNNFTPPSHAAYVTFENEKEASLAILACDQFQLLDRTIKASFGTTKYCTNFLKGSACKNKECVYLHQHPKEKDNTEILKKIEMNNTKWMYAHSQKIAAQSVTKNLSEFADKKTRERSTYDSVFPTTDEVLQRMISIRQLSEEQLQEIKTQKTSKSHEGLHVSYIYMEKQVRYNFNSKINGNNLINPKKRRNKKSKNKIKWIAIRRRVQTGV